jgi:WD40 repeat protein
VCEAVSFVFEEQGRARCVLARARAGAARSGNQEPCTSSTSLCSLAHLSTIPPPSANTPTNTTKKGNAAAPISEDDDGGGDGNGGGPSTAPMEGDHEDDDGEDDSLQVFDGHGDAVLAVAWSPAPAPAAAAAGTAAAPATLDLVATGGQDDGAYLWRVGQDALEATAGTLSTTRLEGHTDSVAALAFSSNGLLLATGGLDGTVRVWEPAAALQQQRAAAPDDDPPPPTPLRVLDGPGGGVEWLAWHPRGEVVLAGCEDYTAWLWLARTGQCLGVLTGHGGPVTAGAFTPDGRTVVTAGGMGDASLRRWSPKTGECTGVLSGHPFHPGEAGRQGGEGEDDDEEEGNDECGGLTCLSIHADGVACLTGAADGTLRVSNLHTMRVIASPEGEKRVCEMRVLFVLFICFFCFFFARAGGARGRRQPPAPLPPKPKRKRERDREREREGDDDTSISVPSNTEHAVRSAQRADNT